MRFCVISPDAAGQVDCVLRNQMLRFLPLESATECDLFVIPVSYYPRYEFEPALLHLKRPYILLDFLEFAWNWHGEENRIGYGALKNYPHLDSPGWAVLDDFVRDHPPLITFKRELLASQKTPTMMPCEHLCYLDIPPIQSKGEFDARPIEVCHVWGWSHPSRAILHADIFRAMTNKNIGVISELNHLDGYFKTPSPRTWASIFKPWYARSPMAEIIALQLKSKISVSLPGAGQKCFRSAEAPVGSIMALQRNDLAWSHPWIGGINCILLEPGREFIHLDLTFTLPISTPLYDIYLAGQKNLRHYQCQRYVDEYIIPSVEAVL